MQLSIKKRIRRRIARGIILIDGIVYCERSHARKVIRQKSPMQGSAAIDARGRPTKDLRDWQKKFVERIENEAWEEMRASQARSSSPTVDYLCQIYAETAAAEYAKEGEPRPSTAAANINKLRQIANSIGVGPGGRVDELTAERVSAWVSSFCAAYPADMQDRARTSAWATVAQARSLWARWTLPVYLHRGLRIPACLTQWPSPKRNYAAAYKRPPETLRAATIAWYRSLKNSSPDRTAWVAATLMIQLAMRPVDAAALTWAQIQPESGHYLLKYIPSKTAGRTSKPRAVTWPVSKALYRALRAAGGELYVVPALTPTDRYDAFIRTLGSAMRALGWDPKTYGKACYELRKLCIDAVHRAHGLEAAVQLSGDNAATIMKYYIDPNDSARAPMDLSKLI